LRAGDPVANCGQQSDGMPRMVLDLDCVRFRIGVFTFPIEQYQAQLLPSLPAAKSRAFGG
jgi:hypothetical protein